MFPLVDTKDPTEVELEVQSAYLEMFAEGNRYFVPRTFGWAIECFSGTYGDYLAIDARYHDFEHTLKGTLCLSRLLRGRYRSGTQPALPQRMFELGILAILLHDTGYLKKRSDPDGTGAKYTITHVARSVELAADLLRSKGFKQPDIQSVQNMIRCTGVNVKLDSIPFHDDFERLVGFALGTSDYLGQMSAPDYVDKLPILWAEFAEAAAYTGQWPGGSPIASPEALMRHTPTFWGSFVRPKLEGDFQALYHFLDQPYPGGQNEYLQSIAVNIARVKRQFASPVAAN